jgi:uncharacterized protein YqhQ
VPAPNRAGTGALTATRDAPLGGQAVIEGVMMRGVRHWAVAVRKPLGDIFVTEFAPEDGARGRSHAFQCCGA